MKTAIISTLLTLSCFSIVYSQNSDSEAVKRAVLNYVEGFYEGDTSKLKASIHSDLSKYGYYIPKNSENYKGSNMTYQEALNYAQRVKDNKRFAKEGSPKDVVLLEVLDQTAVAKLTAWWGIDYMLLAKENGKWMIMKVLWQSPPKS